MFVFIGERLDLVGFAQQAAQLGDLGFELGDVAGFVGRLVHGVVDLRVDAAAHAGRGSDIGRPEPIGPSLLELSLQLLEARPETVVVLVRSQAPGEACEAALLGQQVRSFGPIGVFQCRIDGQHAMEDGVGVHAAESKLAPRARSPMSRLVLAVALALTACGGTTTAPTTTAPVATTSIPATSTPTPTTTSTPATTVVATPQVREFVDAADRFTFDYYSTWSVTVDAAGDVTVSSPPSDEDDAFSEYVQIYTLDPAATGIGTPQDAVVAIATELTGTYDAVEVLFESADTTDGEPNYGALFQVADGPDVFFLAYSATMRDGVVYVSAYIGADEFEALLPQASIIDESFRWGTG